MSEPLYADLGDQGEDERIQIIGSTVMNTRKTVTFVTDADKGKAERYIEKLKARFLGIVILHRGKGPVRGTVAVKVGPPNIAGN